jgi:U2 small nuclear ribonucleoprotein A'
LNSLLFHRHFADNLHEYIPNIETLVLTNNNIEELTQIDNLCKFKNLRCLSLLRNPIASLKNYRLYAIYKLPQLKLLDFKKVKLNERQEAQALFKGKKLKTADSQKPKTFTPGAQYTQQPTQPQQHKASKEELDAIRVWLLYPTSIYSI